MTSERTSRIEAILTDAFSPDELRVKDQSHLHAGHAGARDGRGHFDVSIVAKQFAGLNRIECHRLIYDALGSLMETDIHALSIHAAAIKTEISA